MSKISFPDILTNYVSTQQLNAIFQQLEEELNNKVLYRNNPVGTSNTMSNDLDVNSNDILNVSTLQAETILLAGESIAGLEVQVNFYAGSIEPTNIQAGDFFYNLTSNTLFYYNGTTYISLELFYQQTLDNAIAAEASELAASGYATDSLNSSIASANSASASLSSQQAAALSETNAENSAIASSNSATASANSATASANSATAAAASYKQFDERYLGQKASAPTLDNDGQALLTGALYFNTTDNTTYVYTGTIWASVSNTASSDAAATSAANALTSENNAATSAANALTSENNASDSASSAATSASTATTQASNAATSASNALASENAAAATYINFDKRYLGQKASAPTLDNQGAALVTGALYFNTTVGDMYVYNGTAWVTVSNTASSDAANTSAIDAANSATASANSATASANSATASANSASAASTSETNAATSESNALTSANTANNHRLSAESARDLALVYKNSAEDDALSAAQSATQAAAIALEDITPRYELVVKTSSQPTLSSNFARNKHERYEVFGNEPKTLLQQWDVERNSTATYFDANGVLKTAAPHQPRIDYSSGEGRLLVEGQSTNLMTQSETLLDMNTDGAAFSDVEGISLSNTTSRLLTEDTSTGLHSFRSYNRTIAANQPHTYSFFVKQNGNRNIWVVLTNAGMWPNTQNLGVIFDLDNITSTVTGGVIDKHNIKAFKNGWFRVSLTATPVESGLTQAIHRIAIGSTGSYAGDGTSGLYFFGLQLEEGDLSSYMPTTISAVTRVADTITPKGDL